MKVQILALATCVVSLTAAASGVFAQEVTVADFDGNGKADLFTTSNEPGRSGWYVSYDGVGEFVQLNISGVQLADMILLDADGDGVDDILAPAKNGFAGAAWYISYGGTKNWSRLNNKVSTGPWSADLNSKNSDLYLDVGNLIAGDFNADGKDDVVMKIVTGPGEYAYVVSYSASSGWEILNDAF